MIYGSVCSGIEAATCAWHPLGWRAAFLSEIEPFPRAVLAHHYPTVPLHGDFTTIQAGQYEPINLLVGGTPCQSFSIAGLRGGMDDYRGNLALEFLRLAQRLRPEWLVFENVPGILSSNKGRDFGSLLGGMVELGYGYAYRVLDAQYFGVPQRRRRVFVVGCLGDWRRAAAVLFERHSLSGNPAPRREAGKSVAGTFTARAKSGGCGQDPNLAAGGYMQPWPASVAPTLDAHYGDKMGLENQHINAGGGCSYLPEVAGCLQERDSKGTDSDTKPGHLIPVIGGGFDVEPMCFSAQDNGRDLQTGVSPTMRKGGDGGGVQLAVAIRTANTSANGHGIADDVEHTLDQAQGQAVAFAPTPFDTTQITSAANYSNPKAGDNCHPLAAGAHPPAIAFDLRGREGGAMPEMNDTASIRAASGGSSRSYVAQPMQVRRLTPMECERLQGFPDGYTDVPYRNKRAADGPRYKALGNSMAVPVMRWIGERIALVNEIAEITKAA